VAFGYCINLKTLFIPRGVTNIGRMAFSSCNNLEAVCFAGNAPTIDVYAFVDSDWPYSNPHSLYSLPGTLGWNQPLAGRYARPWHLACPIILTTRPNFGIRDGQNFMGNERCNGG
jgi:hypothetical protein